MSNPKGINQYTGMTGAQRILAKREAKAKLRGVSAKALHAGRAQEMRLISASQAFITAANNRKR